jgi:phosphatidylinositol alpha-1,6-mannosyltransferase
MPLRILFLTDQFLPHAGGSRFYYFHLGKELVENFGVDLTIQAGKVDGWRDFDRCHSTERFKIRRLHTAFDHTKYRAVPRMAVPLLHAMKLVASARPDIVHCGDLIPQSLIGLILRRLFKIPLIVYCHGEEIRPGDNRRHYPQIRNYIYREADAVIAACSFARRNLVSIGISDQKILTVTPGVDCDRFQPARKREDLVCRYNLADKTVLLTVARLLPRKNHSLVLHAMARLCMHVPNLHYLIVGIGPEEDRLRGLVRELNLDRNVTMAGYIADRDLPDVYNLCDIFIMPNREEINDAEGFGMVFTEANACGKPVIGGRSGGTADSIVDGVTGLLADPESVDDLEAKLRLILSDTSLRDRLGSQGLSRARSDFNWAARAKLIYDLSSNLVQQRLAPRGAGKLESAAEGRR